MRAAGCQVSIVETNGFKEADASLQTKHNYPKDLRFVIGLGEEDYGEQGSSVL